MCGKDKFETADSVVHYLGCGLVFWTSKALGKRLKTLRLWLYNCNVYTFRILKCQFAEQKNGSAIKETKKHAIDQLPQHYKSK